ncbi:hypothetical protein MDA_GLEAN10010500 [Myotis davidii]|uniref:Uncharacterized protein n=1 Tax=Myotis davidii TaxID=225400 RepID=L5MBQ6_MYODS|nr:hypothetical protein MDA_GLEAN10010500 [Myotis davidii]
MVEQVSGGSRPRQRAGRCHWGKPLVVTENSLLPCVMTYLALVSTGGARRQSRSLSTISGCEWRLPALITPEGFSTSPCSRGAIGAAAAAHTRCWSRPQLLCAVSRCK